MGYEDEYEAGGSFYQRCMKRFEEIAEKEAQEEKPSEVTSTCMEPEKGRTAVYHWKDGESWTTYEYD